MVMARRHQPFKKIVFPAFLSALLLTPAIPLQAQDAIVRGELPAMPEISFHPQPEGYEVQDFTTGLEVVWAIKFSPDERIFVTERPGRVRILDLEGNMQEEPWLDISDRVLFQGESGLMGLALHPDFPATPWVYLMYTARTDDGLKNRIVRITEENGRAGEEKILLDGLPVQERGGSHSGGTLRFGEDGMLYASTGDAFQMQRSADLDDPAGAVLRLTPDGEVPADNPIPGNPIWAYGLRNVHGLDWQPETGNLFAADHGPTGEDRLMAHDRVLVLQEGRHHGWPAVVGAPGLPDYVDPFLTFAPSSAPPGDLIFYTGDLMPELKNDLFVSILGFQTVDRQSLLRVRFEDAANPAKPTTIERWFNDAEGNSVYGRLRALAVGPDGALYVGTSNHDGRQTAVHHRESKDRILRIVPKGN